MTQAVTRGRLLTFAAALGLSLPAIGCQAILGIKDPVVGIAGTDGAVGGGDASASADGRPGMPDAQAGNLDGGGYGIPTYRSEQAMVYDPARKRLVLFGGESGGGPINDTWEFDGTGWRDVTPASENPPARSSAMMA